MKRGIAYPSFIDDKKFDVLSSINDNLRFIF